MGKPTIAKKNHKNINAKDNCLPVFKMQIIAFKLNRKGNEYLKSHVK